MPTITRRLTLKNGKFHLDEKGVDPRIIDVRSSSEAEVQIGFYSEKANAVYIGKDRTFPNQGENVRGTKVYSVIYAKVPLMEDVSVEEELSRR